VINMKTGHAGTAILAALLTACSAGKGSQPSQVVAKVNGSEITVSQVAAELLARGADAATTPHATKAAIDGLIDEQLLYTQAQKQELDRDPTVVQALERARRQVLVRAYAERTVFPNEPISTSEQIDYYRKHPDLFEKRRSYELIQYTIRSGDLGDAIRTELDQAHTPDAVARILSVHKIGYRAQTLTRDAEQLPLDALSDFAAASVGDVLISPARDGQAGLLLITRIQDSPIDLEHAQPLIQQYLVNDRNTRLLEARLKQMRATATITYGNTALN
jgi:EpsD family peptidyl-prolyl cis-trans isomerase